MWFRLYVTEYTQQTGKIRLPAELSQLVLSMRSENICVVVDNINIHCAAVPFENGKDVVYPVSTFLFRI